MHLELALKIGCASRRELYERVTRQELQELEALYQIDPWGEARADLRAGIVAAAAVSPYLKRGRKASPTDFMPKFGKRPIRQQDHAEMKAIALSLAKRFGKSNG